MSFSYQHGIAVMRAQPLHIGHQKIIQTMLQTCKAVTIVLGSVQECGTARNPFDYIMRKQMILNCFPQPQLHIIGVPDINNPLRWPYFVCEQIAQHFPHLPEPDVYFAGSEYDAHWFEPKFSHIEIIDRNNPNVPFVSGTMVREMIAFGDERWQNFVAPKNVALIQQYLNDRKVEI